MPVSFDVYRIAQDGHRKLVRTTQSAHEARKVRDTDPGEMLVYVRDDGKARDEQYRHNLEVDMRGEVQGDIEGDYPI